MKFYLLKYFIYLSLFTIILTAIGLSLFNYPLHDYDFPGSSVVFCYFFLIALAEHYLIIRSAEDHPQQVISYAMGGVVVKLLLAMGIMLIYWMIYSAHIKSFIITFGAGYLLYTLFGLVGLVRHFSKLQFPDKPTARQDA